MSGHNKWSTIKHRKGAQDAKRSRLFTKIIREITVAARNGGGDPAGNPRLRRAIEDAKAANMPSENIERAIKKGTGQLDGVRLESLTYEGVGPGGTLFLVDIVTDNRNRTAPEVRKIFERHGGQLGASGSAAWAFEEKGVLKIPAEASSEEQLFEVAVGAGAEDLEQVGEHWVVRTGREDYEAVRSALDEAGIPVEEASLGPVPKTVKVVDGPEAEKNVALFEALENHDDVENVAADFELSEAALQRLQTS